jgi:hypothetical protein
VATTASVVGSEDVGTTDAGVLGSELVAAADGWEARKGAAGLGDDEQPAKSAAQANVTQTKKASRCGRANAYRMTEA